MFSERLKKWIYKTVKDDYQGDIYRDIDLFEKSLMLKAPDEKLEGINEVLPEVLEGMSDPARFEYALESIDRFIKIEPFLRHLLGVLYPKRYKISPRDEENGLSFDEWTFAPLLKQAFEIIPRNYNISKRKPDYISFPYKSFYDIVYDTRNSSAHNFVDMSPRKTYEVITACLVVYLDISAYLSLQIEDAFSKETISDGFLAMPYCRDIVYRYNLETANGFSYVNIKWKANNSNTTEYSTVETIMDEKSNSLIKILGEAGSGKTTIMKQLVYLSAQKYIKNKSAIVPVFIQLGDIETNPLLRADIKAMICSKLGIELNLLEEMFSQNTLRLYLDGFNEILSIKVKKQIAWSIDDLSRQYPKLTIFLSDRSLVKSSIDTMRSALTYRLYPLDNEMKRRFIECCCLDQNAKEMLLNYLDTSRHYYEYFKTPIQLKQLIELTTQRQRIPEDFCGEYIQFLINREMVEKKDENVEYLEAFACSLALSEDEKLSEYKAEACIAKCKRVLGYTIPDSRRCLRLLIEMGILVMEDGVIEFSYSSYRDYFWMIAIDKHLEELLEVN